MRKNKKLYGLVAGFMALAIASPLLVHNVAKADSLYSDVVAWYNFDDGKLENLKGDTNAKAIIKGLGAYSGNLVFEDDRTGDTLGSKSLRLDGYGLELNEDNLGENFSVSLWMKPNNLEENQSVLFLGYNDPEKWFGIAGDVAGNNTVKVWCHDGVNYKWQTKNTTSLSKNTWHHVVITGQGQTHLTYIDGVCVNQSKSDFVGALTGDKQDIYVGVTNWDKAFGGLVDDIMVYNRPLSAGEVDRLYKGLTTDIILKNEGISVADISTVVNRTAQVNVTIPEAVREDAKLSYEIADATIAKVDADGNITGLKEGETTLTVTAKIGKVVKTAESKVSVEATFDKYLLASLSLDGTLEDSTGNITVTPIVKGLGAYNGELLYEKGVSGQALLTKNYGIDLNLKNVGKEFTVSFYAKPLDKQAENQVMMLMGYHNPELWTAISGRGQNEVYKLWGKGANLSHTTLMEPVVKNGEWSQITLVGVDGKITAYIDGISLGTAAFNNPLVGEKQDILFGANYWDACFNGLFDDIKVYNIAMTEEEVQSQNEAFCEGKLEGYISSNLPMEKLLKNNTSKDAVKYDVNLPSVIGTLPVTWTSSNEKLISVEGKITNPSEDTEVVLTASVNSGKFVGKVEYKLTLLALDKSKLEELIKSAEEVDLTYADEQSKIRIPQVLGEAREAKTYAQIEDAQMKLEKVLAALVIEDAYADPFAAIAEATTSVELEVNNTETVFVLPESVQDFVTVVYETNNAKVAEYTDGIVTAKAEGNALVKAIVTAKYDGFTMEYATAVSVKEPYVEPVHTHSFVKEVKKSSVRRAGSIIEKCSGCGEVRSTTEIPRIGSIVLEEYHFIYDKKPHQPKAIVNDVYGRYLEEGKDFTVKYSSNGINKGAYTATITFKDNYEGSDTKIYYVESPVVNKVAEKIVPIVEKVANAVRSIFGSIFGR